MRVGILQSVGCLMLLMVTYPVLAQVQRKPGTDPRLGRVEKICGRDVYPDLTITNAEIRKSDDIMVTVASTANCNAGAFRLTMLIKEGGKRRGQVYLL